MPGPKQFAARLRNAGLPLILPVGAEPNLSLILGGAGARLADITAAYSAFARHGKVGKLRMLASDPLVERPLLSPGAAWILDVFWREAQPVPDASLPQVPSLAWKTGTNYGYRDVRDWRQCALQHQDLDRQTRWHTGSRTIWFLPAPSRCSIR